MINLKKARDAFDDYVSHYDQTIPAIHLKIIHTYEVMKCSNYLCDMLSLDIEEKTLASLIGLLHDIGRFEQWMKYQTFEDYKSVDHALYSSQLLFEQGLIRKFVDDHQYDDIIRKAIEQHNRFEIEDGFNERELLFIHLIRDADKLDNFRVKEEESIEAIFSVSLETVCKEKITPAVYQQVYAQKLVYGPTRLTHLDMWLSYIAFLFDLHYDVSIQYIKNNNWVNRSFERIHPIDKQTKKQYQILKQRVLDYLK